MNQTQEDAAPSDAVDAQEYEQCKDAVRVVSGRLGDGTSGESALEAEIEADATQDVTPQPDPAKVAAAEAELAQRRAAAAMQGQAAGFLGVLPVQVVRLSPVAVEGVEGQQLVDITVRVDTRSYEWQRTFAQRVVRAQQ